MYNFTSLSSIIPFAQEFPPSSPTGRFLGEWESTTRIGKPFIQHKTPSRFPEEVQTVFGVAHMKTRPIIP